MALWDGITGTASAPTHTHPYTQSGVYTVSLTANGPGGSDTLTRTNDITVTAGEPSYTSTITLIAYTYDALDRLSGAEYSSGESYAYQYDAVGNREALTSPCLTKRACPLRAFALSVTHIRPQM